MKVLSVVLCGGAGSRLWPLSREQYPKQLLPLMGESSLLQDTLKRLEGCGLEQDFEKAPALVVANEEYRFLVAEQVRAIRSSQARIALEPCGRNTAPALTVAALLCREDDPLMVVMPADHVLGDLAAFQRALRQALAHAAEGRVVTFGVVPSAPDTGFGYIRRGAPLPGGGFDIQAFVEKPDRVTAASYLSSGDYLWNSGIFVMRSSVWLAQLGARRPDMLSACEAAVAEGASDQDFIRLGATAFAACPADSIDYAVMEHLAGGAGVVVPLDAAWSDVGSWGALWEIGAKDGAGNVLRGDVLALESEDCYLRSEHRLVACVGVRDVVVVETPDAVLVAHKDHLQSVKQLVSRLKQEGRPESDAHRKIFRPWGHYDSIDAGHRFQVKRIVVDPGARLSLQMHHHRAEHWIVVSGTAKVTMGEKTLLLTENQSTYIPLGVAHRLENPGRIPLEMIEVQSGSYLGEDDIVRFEDNYGRS
ncbi:MAG: mannose-1-phosphate guanylyltransferase/mannose-6-phosphate isomerase [Azovibrio sp.]|uniref:mannose-1-phosphate guanylyltransferase/mannose-6-phosphate isomerase n=1 Tax=Azovibrio sp. TaxID=1872673 RepID=UPI003C70F3FE